MKNILGAKEILKRGNQKSRDFDGVRLGWGEKMFLDDEFF